MYQCCEKGTKQGETTCKDDDSEKEGETKDDDSENEEGGQHAPRTFLTYKGGGLQLPFFTHLLHVDLFFYLSFLLQVQSITNSSFASISTRPETCMLVTRMGFLVCLCSC